MVATRRTSSWSGSASPEDARRSRPHAQAPGWSLLERGRGVRRHQRDGGRALLPRRRYSGAAGHRRRGLRRGDVQVPDGGQPGPRRGQDPRLLRRQRRALRLDRGAGHGVRAVALREEGRHPARHAGADVHRQREGAPVPRPCRSRRRAGHKVPKPGDTGGAKIVLDALADRIAETSADVRYETGATNLVVAADGASSGVQWRRYDERGDHPREGRGDRGRWLRRQRRDGRGLHPGARARSCSRSPRPTTTGSASGSAPRPGASCG